MTRQSTRAVAAAERRHRGTQHAVSHACKSSAAPSTHNGSIASAQADVTRTGQLSMCLSKGDNHGAGDQVNVIPCGATASQVWKTAANADGSYTISQNGACLDNNFRAADAPAAEWWQPAAPAASAGGRAYNN